MRDDFFVNSIIVLQEKATSTWGIHQIRDHPHVWSRKSYIKMPQNRPQILGPLGLSPPLVLAGLAENFGVLRHHLDDFLSKIDDFEVQILKIFSPATGFP